MEFSSSPDRPAAEGSSPSQHLYVESDIETEAGAFSEGASDSDPCPDASSAPECQPREPGASSWATCWVQPAAPGSQLPAFCVCALLNPESDAYINRITLHASRGGPGDSWVLSMDHGAVVRSIEYLYEAHLRGHQIVTWGGRTFLACFQQYDLSPEHREHLRVVVERQIDLEASVYVSGGAAPDAAIARFLEGAISHPPPFSDFPFAEWWSGVRLRQLGAIHIGFNYMEWLSTVWREVSGQYTQTAVCVSFGELCSDQTVSEAFGHPPAVSRRLSETMQDSFDSFI